MKFRVLRFLLDWKCPSTTAAAALGLILAATLSGASPGTSDRHLLVTFSWGAGNMSDVAMTPGLLSLLQEAQPDLPVIVMTMQGADSPVYRQMADYLPRYSKRCRVVPNPFFIGGSEEPGPAGSAWQAFHQRWGTSTLRAFENGTLSARVAARVADDILNRLPHELLEEVKRTDPDTARALTEAGFVMMNSGTMLNYGRMGQRRFFQSSMRYALPMLLARVQGIPYGVGGQSFEALDWPAELIFRPLFREARFVYCRDPDSLEYLAQRDLLAKSSGFRPDGTFFFRGFDEPWFEQFKQAHSLQDRRFIALTIRSARSQPGPLADTITREREDAHLMRIRAFITDWVERTGIPVVLFPEVKTEIASLRERIYQPLAPEVQRQCVLLKEFWSPEQAYSLFRRAEFIVSMEMHSVILALSLGVPALMPQFVENGRKVWMLEELGLSDWTFDIDDPADSGRLLDAALAIHHDRPVAEARIQKHLPRLRQLGWSVATEIMLARRP